MNDKLVICACLVQPFDSSSIQPSQVIIRKFVHVYFSGTLCMPFFYGIYNGSMRTLYEKVGLFYIFLTGPLHCVVFPKKFID
jgi:hypothetical protein